MKIVSWNVAGLRACLNKGFDRFFEEEKADIYCLQETKVLEEQNPFHPYGYYEYLFPAEKKGYSGTMMYTKEKPISVIYGIGVEEYDKQYAEEHSGKYGGGEGDQYLSNPSSLPAGLL